MVIKHVVTRLRIFLTFFYLMKPVLLLLNISSFVAKPIKAQVFGPRSLNNTVNYTSVSLNEFATPTNVFSSNNSCASVDVKSERKINKKTSDSITYYRLKRVDIYKNFIYPAIVDTDCGEHSKALTITHNSSQNGTCKLIFFLP